MHTNGIIEQVLYITVIVTSTKYSPTQDGKSNNNSRDIISCEKQLVDFKLAIRTTTVFLLEFILRLKLWICGHVINN